MDDLNPTAGTLRVRAKLTNKSQSAVDLSILDGAVFFLLYADSQPTDPSSYALFFSFDSAIPLLEPGASRVWEQVLVQDGTLPANGRYAKLHLELFPRSGTPDLSTLPWRKVNVDVVDIRHEWSYSNEGHKTEEKWLKVTGTLVNRDQETWDDSRIFGVMQIGNKRFWVSPRLLGGADEKDCWFNQLPPDGRASWSRYVRESDLKGIDLDTVTIQVQFFRHEGAIRDCNGWTEWERQHEPDGRTRG